MTPAFATRAADPDPAVLDFYPPALEIQDRPALPAARAILWCIIVFTGVAILWSWFGHVDVVAMAQGRIVPAGRVKEITAPDTAIITAIPVAEGDHVSVGQRLAELDASDASADLDRQTRERQALVLDAARLEALLAATAASDQVLQSGVADAPAGPAADPAREFDDVSGVAAADRSHALRHYRQALTEFTAGVDALTEEGHRTRAERLTLERRVAQIDATLPLISERVMQLAQLADRRLVARSDWLALEADRVAQQRGRDVLQAQFGVLDTQLANIRQRQRALVSHTRAQWLAQVTELRTRIAGYADEMARSRQRLARRVLAAPVAGTVQQLKVHTVGGTVTVGQSLMHIVPDDDALQIEAWIANRDIGFVHPGQAAEIKIATFEFTRYGTLSGEITTVSSDAIADERLGLVYLVQVKLPVMTMRVAHRRAKLGPGMAVTVEVNLGRRRVIEYLLSPLLRYSDESMRER